MSHQWVYSRSMQLYSHLLQGWAVGKAKWWAQVDHAGCVGEGKADAHPSSSWSATQYTEEAVAGAWCGEYGRPTLVTTAILPAALNMHILQLHVLTKESWKIREMGCGVWKGCCMYSMFVKYEEVVPISSVFCDFAFGPFPLFNSVFYMRWRLRFTQI